MVRNIGVATCSRRRAFFPLGLMLVVACRDHCQQAGQPPTAKCQPTAVIHFMCDFDLKIAVPFLGEHYQALSRKNDVPAMLGRRGTVLGL